MSDKAVNLAEKQQQHLLAAIYSDEPVSKTVNGFEEQGIAIYRRNLLANAQRALSISFPTVFELLDSDVGANLTQQFLRYSPPNQGDWALWGSHFSAFIKDTEIAQDYAYLADCAALDWGVHVALHGPDHTLSTASMQLLANCDLEKLVVIFNQNVQLFKTPYPLLAIFDAHHQQQQKAREAALRSAKQALSLPLEDHFVMIYRPQFHPEIRCLSHSEGRFMVALMAQKSLSEALDVVSDDADFSFETWLLNAVEHNLIHNLQETQQ